jgi:hypothetical protein
MFEIGNTLREARLRRGLDIADCEAATKIRAKYLRALEDEQFEVLPGSTYVKGFLRTYAEYLELDGRLVIDEYESRFGRRSDHHLPDADPVRRRARRRRGREGRVLAIAAGLVMIASVALWAGFADDPSPPPGDDGALVLVFRAAGAQDTYLEVRADGPRGPALFTPGPVGVGQSRTVTAEPPVWVHVGDGSGLRLSVDGRTVTTPPGKTEFRVLEDGAIQSSTLN